MRLAMMTRAAALLLAVASITFTSCKKDKGNSNPVEQTRKLSRIEENGQTTATFTYNTDATLKTLLIDFGPFGSTAFEFTYNAQKKISQVVSSEGFTSKYSYEGGNLVWIENYEDGEKIGENDFQYENGKVKSNTVLTPYPDGNGNVVYKPTFRTIYTYYASGNVQKISTYVLGANNQLELDHEYVYQQYDGKKNPLAVMSDFSQAFMYQPISINNPLIEKWYNATGGVDETTENEYTYDAAGYPVTIKSTTTTGGTPTVRTTKLYY
jgi:hypothetical protein